MYRRSSALSRTTWRTTETTVAAEIRDADEGRLWSQRRPVASCGSSHDSIMHNGQSTLLCVAAPESSHMLFNNDDGRHLYAQAPHRTAQDAIAAHRHGWSSRRS